MLKIRIIPVLLYKDNTLVKGKKYDSWRRIGSLMQAIKVYNLRQVDELIFLDITASQDGRQPDFELVDDFADECFMPLTVGGGIKTIEQVKKLLSVGADKVSISTAAIENPRLINDIANKFGAQCIVVSIDVKIDEKGIYKVYSHSGTKITEWDPVSFAIEVERRNAGEILLNSIDLDGTMEGYDLDLIKRVSDAVSIPVIASGGAGNYEHMRKALQIANASAIAASSMFQFTQQTPIEAKKYLKNYGLNVRIFK